MFRIRVEELWLFQDDASFLREVFKHSALLLWPLARWTDENIESDNYLFEANERTDNK
jgi:hypothetical protein